VLLTAEDDPADTIRPRLDAAGADVTKISLLRAVQWYDAERGKRTSTQFSLARDLPALRMAIEQAKDCRLVVIDPISAYLGEADSHKNSEVRAVLAPLAELAQEMGVAIVSVTHLNKGSGAALYRSMGSVAFVAAVRAAWAVVKDRDNEERRLVLPLKNNLALDCGGLAYSVMSTGDGVPYLAWEPEPVTMTADEAMAPADDKDKDRRLRNEAANWLKDELQSGPAASQQLFTRGKAGGFSEKTLRRAKHDLRLRAYKEGFGSGSTWMWALPFTEEDQTCP
jgi:hypothetical protein